LFITMVPVRVRCASSETLLSLLTRLQHQQSHLTAHQHLGLARIQQIAGFTELFDTALVFENYPWDTNRLPSRTDTAASAPPHIPLIEAHTHTHYPLTLLIEPTPHLRLHLDYCGDLFDRFTIEGVAGRLVRLLEVVAADPETPISRIDLLTADERGQLLID